MSRSAYASSLKNLGGAFRTKGTANSAGGSESGANREDGAESAAPSINVDGIPDPPSLEDPIIHGSPDAEDRPRPKRMKNLGKKPPRPQNVPLDDKDDVLETLAGEGGPDAVRVHSVKEVAKMMSEIPSNEDWIKMEEAGLNTVMQKCTEQWRHVSSFSNLMFSFNTLYVLLKILFELYTAWEIDVRCYSSCF